MHSKVWGLAAAALVLGATACSGSGRVSVSAASATAETTTGTGSIDLGNGVLVSRVRLAVQKVELEGDDGHRDGGSDDGAGHMLVADTAVAHDGGDDDGAGNHGEGDDADEVKVGPFLIDLTGDQLTGGIKHVFDADVPAGTFEELKVVVGPVDPANAGFAAMNGESVIVDGTVTTTGADGTTTTTPFSFQSTLRAAQQQESEIVVASSGASSNVTLTIDPSGWFKAADGSRLDPNDAAAKARIENNIRASIRAFCDRDRDGEDDHGHDGPGHH
jgi:hypothetical protein